MRVYKPRSSRPRNGHARCGSQAYAVMSTFIALCGRQTAFEGLPEDGNKGYQNSERSGEGGGRQGAAFAASNLFSVTRASGHAEKVDSPT